MKRISVIGFGKIGQAVAANILQKDIRVTAIDSDPGLGKLFESAAYHTMEPGLEEILPSAYRKGLLEISTDYSLVKDSEAIILAIPLLVDDEKKILDLPFLDAAMKLAPFLRNNTVVVIETTVPVGYCRNFVLPALESTGIRHGLDFLLAHSPERIKSGTMLEQLHLIPKIIGGINTEATEKACQVYRWFFDDNLLRKVESVESAELLKLAGMIYRDVNIALSNQLAQFAHKAGINFTDLIPLINTDREADLLQPGIGVGGHCTPVYPYFMIRNFRDAGLEFTLALESRKINDGMAAYAISKLGNAVRSKKALLLGLGFRPNVKEDALSTTYLLHDSLVKSGYEVFVHDTGYSDEEIRSKGLIPSGNIYDLDAEVVFLVTMHDEYYHLDFEKMFRSGIRFLIDGRNCINRNAVKKAGIRYFGIGR